MSTRAQSRTQYVYVEAKRSSNSWGQSRVTLYGPKTVLTSIQAQFAYRKPDSVSCVTALFGNSMKMELSGTDLMFMKATLLEEVLKLGFKLLSNIKDDALTLSREVKL